MNFGPGVLAAAPIKNSKVMEQFSPKTQGYLAKAISDMPQTVEELLNDFSVRPKEELSKVYAREAALQGRPHSYLPPEVGGLYVPPGAQVPYSAPSIQIRDLGEYMNPYGMGEKIYTSMDQAFTTLHEHGHLGHHMKEAIDLLQQGGRVKLNRSDPKIAASQIGSQFPHTRFGRGTDPRMAESVADLVANELSTVVPLARREKIMDAQKYFDAEGGDVPSIVKAITDLLRRSSGQLP